MSLRSAMSALLAIKSVRKIAKDFLRGVDAGKLRGWLQRLALARSREPRERIARAFDGFLTQRAVDAILPFVEGYLDQLDELTDLWVEHARETKGDIDDAFFGLLDDAVDRLIDAVRDEPATTTADATA